MKGEKFKWPKVSFLLLTYNGGDGVRKCLESIKGQDYPEELIDIVVVDDKSTDNSVEIAKSFGARVFVSGKKDMYLSWAIGLHKIKGDFVYLVEQDIELKGRKFLKKMIRPLVLDKSLAASFTRKYPRQNQPWITRFISYHPAQCDPLYEFLTPPVENSFVDQKRDYVECTFKLGELPPFGRMFYRVSFMKKASIWAMERCFDHDLLVKMIRAGYDKYAYVPSAGIYHNHALSLRHLLTKRVRNLQMHYFPYQETLEYRWLDIGDKKSVLKAMLWVIYANLFFPAVIRGFLRFLKHRDWALLMEPIVTITTTDAILWNFLRDKVGRNILKRAIKTLVTGGESEGAFGLKK